MALFDRGPIPPKKIKLRSEPTRDLYRRNNPHCEKCKIEGHISIHSKVEIHHILPGGKRSDEKWNLISLCPGCHDLVTEHKYGNIALMRNWVLLGIKYLKKEISDAKLVEIGCHEQVMAAVIKLEPMFEENCIH